jgi:hypothetical protein
MEQLLVSRALPIFGAAYDLCTSSASLLLHEACDCSSQEEV